MQVKQVIVFRKDLNCRKGKIAAQAAHACQKDLLQLYLSGVKPEDFDEEQKAYYLGIFRKICVYVKSEQELLDVHNAALAAGLKSYLIEDNGLTEFHGVKTKTCIAIGPHADERINPITGHLPLY